MSGLTCELSGHQRHDARPASWMINNTGSRAWRHAVGAPLERGVRHQFSALAGACLLPRFDARLNILAQLRTGPLLLSLRGVGLKLIVGLSPFCTCLREFDTYSVFSSRLLSLCRNLRSLLQVLGLRRCCGLLKPGSLLLHTSIGLSSGRLKAVLNSAGSYPIRKEIATSHGKQHNDKELAKRSIVRWSFEWHGCAGLV